MKKSLLFMILFTIIGCIFAAPVYASYPEMIRWRGELYFTPSRGKMVNDDILKSDYTLLGEIELVVGNKDEIPYPSADNKATSNDFTVGDKIYQGNIDGKLYIYASRTYQPSTGKTKLFPMLTEEECKNLDFSNPGVGQDSITDIDQPVDITLGAGVEDANPF